LEILAFVYGPCSERYVNIQIPHDYITLAFCNNAGLYWPIQISLNPGKNIIELKSNNHVVHIPIGRITRLSRKKHSVKISKSLHLVIEQHAVELVFEMTAWKYQRGTIPFVFAFLPNNSLLSLNSCTSYSQG
jgi:hypothetical protein